MSRIAYVNGRYLRHAEAEVHVEDRGYQFSDGVYEVCALRDGQPLDEALHLQRLKFSLGELKIPMPMSDEALRHVLREVARLNGLSDGIVYIQVTRGVAPRDHAFPAVCTPSLVITAKRINRAAIDRSVREGVGVATMPDERWARPEIKSVSLLPNVLAKQAAKEAGAYEAWLVDGNGFVTEGSSTNAWIVDKEGVVITRPVARDILNGVTRRVVIETAKALNIKILEKPFTVEEIYQASEAFLTASTAIIVPVVRVNERQVGDGTPGPATMRLRAAYPI